MNPEQPRKHLLTEVGRFALGVIWHKSNGDWLLLAVVVFTVVALHGTKPRIGPTFISFDCGIGVVVAVVVDVACTSSSFLSVPVDPCRKVSPFKWIVVCERRKHVGGFTA